jgi:hypothetical protein
MRTDLVDNINEVEARPTGTSHRAAIRRLAKERPDLLEKVKAGLMTAHAAMCQAGCRRRAITLPDDDVRTAARSIGEHFNLEQVLREPSQQHLTAEQVRTLVRELERSLDRPTAEPKSCFDRISHEWLMAPIQMGKAILPIRAISPTANSICSWNLRWHDRIATALC